MSRKHSAAGSAASIALVFVLAGCAASASGQDRWSRRVEIVPASEVPVRGVVRPGTPVPLPHAVLLSGASMRDVRIRTLPDRGSWMVFELDQHGRRTMMQVTRRGVGQQLLFVLDGTVVSAPVIKEPITTGHFMVPVGYDSLSSAEGSDAEATPVYGMP